MAYHHHRYYLPWLGRWASEDPAGLVDGPNRYVYARGSPVGGKDPSGLAAAQFPRPPSIPPGLEKRLLIEADIWTDKVTALADAAAAVKSDPMGALVQAARRTPAGLAAQGQWSDAAGAYVDALAAPLRTGADALMGAPEQVAHVAGYWTESDPGVIRAHRERSLEITAAQAELGGLAGAPAGGELIRRGLRSVPRLLDDAPMPMGLMVRGAADASQGGFGAFRARARHLGFDPDRGVLDVREGIAGARLEGLLGRQIRRGEAGADFVDDAVGGLGSISLKGPLPARARGNAQGLLRSATDDLSLNSGADSLVVDLRGLSAEDAATVRSGVEAALPGARYPKTLVFMD